ncbi:MAG: hypothetical protein ING59_12050 [Burkholderiales bacterium]|nr:hypothetical protein [Burkholderiales bacterium]
MCDRPERDEPGELHQDLGWTPEGLRAELEKGGAEFDEEIAKLHRLGALRRETHQDRAGGARTTLFRAEPEST